MASAGALFAVVLANIAAVFLIRMVPHPSTRASSSSSSAPRAAAESTLLRLVQGSEGIDGGTLMLDSRDITDQPSSKRDLAMVFQSYALYPHMSVYENMSFALKLAKGRQASDRREVQNAARILNLTEYLQRTPRGCRAASASVAAGRAIVCATQGVFV